MQFWFQIYGQWYLFHNKKFKYHTNYFFFQIQKFWRGKLKHEWLYLIACVYNYDLFKGCHKATNLAWDMNVLQPFSFGVVVVCLVVLSWVSVVLKRTVIGECTRLSSRAVTRNTCYGWICLIGTWCYGWSQLLLVQLADKATTLLREFSSVQQVTQNLMTALTLLIEVSTTGAITPCLWRWLPSRFWPMPPTAIL